MPLQLECTNGLLQQLIDADQEPCYIGTGKDGLIFTEGPVWSRRRQELIFSDIAGNAMYRWNENSGLRQMVSYSYKANGNACLPNAGIITCEHATSRISFRKEDGSGYMVLVSHYEGKELNSPNDVVVHSDGSIYFTDPFFGRNPSRVGVERERELDFCGIYRLKDSQLMLLDDSCQTPNGLCFSEDEQQLYVADSVRDEIVVYDVCPNGSIRDKRLFAKTCGSEIGHPDGLKLDEDGNLYCCAQGGIHIFSHKGEFLGRIVFPFQVANIAFGGRNMQRLFVCAVDQVFSIETRKKGLIGGMNL